MSERLYLTPNEAKAYRQGHRDGLAENNTHDESSIVLTQEEAARVLAWYDQSIAGDPEDATLAARLEGTS